MTKKVDESIEVEVLDLKPATFQWRGRRYHVDRLLKYWREAGEAWDPERVRDHECFRVEAAGGTYDLRHDRLAGSAATWRLVRVWD